MLDAVGKLHLFVLSFWLAVYKMSMRVMKNQEGFLSAALTGKLLIENGGNFMFISLFQTIKNIMTMIL